MRMKQMFAVRLLSLLAAALLLAATGSAQSLGEVARQQRAKKAGPAAKPNRVYTDENLPHEGGLSTTAVEPAAKAKPGEKERPAPTGEAKKSSAEEEKAYREKFAKLRETLAYEEKKLDVLQREYNLAAVQAYSDPNVALREQVQRTELNTRQQEIEKQKAAVEAAKKAISGLEEELRTKSLPAGWAR